MDGGRERESECVCVSNGFSMRHAFIYPGQWRKWWIFVADFFRCYFAFAFQSDNSACEVLINLLLTHIVLSLSLCHCIFCSSSFLSHPYITSHHGYLTETHVDCSKCMLLSSLGVVPWILWHLHTNLVFYQNGIDLSVSLLAAAAAIQFVYMLLCW